MNQKRNETIKMRACADGNKERRYIKKEDSSSPTVYLESVIILLLIDATENRDVATVDIAGAHLFTDMKDFVFIKLVGSSVIIMCEKDISYKKYITKEGKNEVLHLQLA